MAEPIRVAIIEDQAEIRQGLGYLIGSTAGFACVGSYPSMEAAIERMGDSRPDLTLVDIGLPGMTGIEGIRVLKAQYPAMLQIVLTVHDDDRRIFDALCAGASGYLLKNTPPARLLEGIQEAMGGGAPISPAVARRVIGLFRDFRPLPKADHDLTPHEIRILSLLVEGHNFKTAAQELGVTRHAVAFHMRNVYDKLQVHSKSEAVAKALRQRLVQ